LSRSVILCFSSFAFAFTFARRFKAVVVLTRALYCIRSRYTTAMSNRE